MSNFTDFLALPCVVVAAVAVVKASEVLSMIGAVWRREQQQQQQQHDDHELTRRRRKLLW